MDNNGTLKKGNQTESYSSTLVLAFVVSSLFLAALLVVMFKLYNMAGSWEPHQAAQTLSYFGAAFFACVAMIIAVWRGVVAQRQTDAAFEQIRRTDEQLKKTEQQLAHTARQIAASEENNLAGLLEKASGLLDDEIPAKRLTGIELLRYIANANTTVFTSVSGALLEGAVLKLGDATVNDDGNKSLIVALNEAGRSNNSNYKANNLLLDRIVFNNDDFPERILGLRFSNCHIVDCQVICRFRTKFTNCRFYTCSIFGHISVYETVEFFSCKIDKLVVYSLKDASVRFKQCDFSSCIELRAKILEMRDCYYFEDSPPNEKVLERYGKFLKARTRTA